MNNGLSKQEALERLNKYGKNVLVTEKKKTKLQIFLSQFINYTTPIFVAAIVICCILKDFGEAGFIGAVLLLNAIVGYVQEGKAQSALDALKKMSNVKAVVKRDGKIIEINSEEIVPGDYVLLEAGKEVPADIKLLVTNKTTGEIAEIPELKTGQHFIFPLNFLLVVQYIITLFR